MTESSPPPAQPDRPLVSIVLACYNSERYLTQTVQSVRSQTYSNWELIAVDDCSSDRTAAILQDFARDDARVKVVSREQRGGRPAITKNTGLQNARGRFVCFLDHDDLYLPSKLEASVNGLLAMPDAVALFHDLHFVDGDGNIQERYLPRLLSDAAPFFTPTGPGRYLSSDRFFAFQMLRYAGFHTITTMIARDRLPADFVLDFNTRYSVCDDTDLWIRLSLAGKVAYLDQSLAHYRIHGNNITSNNLKVVEDIARLLEFNLAHRAHRLTDVERQGLHLRFANTLGDLGWANRRAGRHSAAAVAYFKALRMQPSLARVAHLAKAFLPASAS